MAKFAIECPRCGKYAEARTGFFSRKKIDCSCGNVIDVRTERMGSAICPSCGNTFAFDRADSDAKCPVCKTKFNAAAGMKEFSCSQCGVRLFAAANAAQYTCPVCDCVNDVQERLKKEAIQHDGMASIIKYEGDNDALVWKHPIEDFNLGSQLIVHESQEAIFFRDGQALDLFGAGRYTLETQQLPLLEKLYKLPTDTEGTFHSEVYFFNKVTLMGVKWGTPDKIRMIDPLTGAPFSLGARGLLNFRIADSRKLLLKLVGTTSGLSRDDLMGGGEGAMKNYFRSIVQQAVSNNLANAFTEERLDVLQVDQQKLRLSVAMLPTLQPFFDEYGLKVANFVIEGIMLPQKGELGYDALQTIIQMRQKDLTKSAIQTETEIKFAEMEAKKKLDIYAQQNAAEVEIARRGVVQQKGETNVLEAQLKGQEKVAETSADVTAERLRMQLEMERKAQMASIEAEEMRMKGFNQRDVLQAEVQKAYAEGIGNMGPTISAGGGGGGSIISDMMGLGVGMAAANAVAPQIGSMMQGFGAQTIGQQAAPAPGQAAAAGSWDCPACGQKGITTNFCPTCGAKKPTPAESWDCPACGQKGITSNFCPNCGAKKPEAPKGWDCPDCGQKNITSNFCPNCGTKKPADDTWTCPDCGQAGIKTNFCPNCGKKKGE